MSIFVSLEDAAKRLGLSTDQLIEMRSRGEIFGYRDGTSWKFKPGEIERVASEILGDVLDEDPAGSSILSLASEHGSSLSGLSSSASGSLSASQSDVSIQVEPGSSDLKLVASSGLSLGEPGEGSGLSHVDEAGLEMANSDDDDDELSLALDDDQQIVREVVPTAPAKPAPGRSASISSSDLNLAGEDSDIDISLSSDDNPKSSISARSSSLGLAGDSSKRSSSREDIIQGDSDPALATDSSGIGSDIDLDHDLQLDDDLVLNDGSDLAIGADSGINLRSPADSGISLEDEPLDLAASGVSDLGLAGEGSDPGSGLSSGLGSGVDFQKDEDFQLTPSGGLEADDDSGSQVIELEDSSEFGDVDAAQQAGEGFDAFGEVSNDMDVFGEAAPMAAGAIAGVPDVPYSVLQVLLLLGILLIMSFSGILVTDVVRNMWAWSGTETNALTSGFTEMLVGIFK